jgi:hypothetical protein
MSGQGSGHAPGDQKRPSNRRSPPQTYHEDSYQRSFSYELSDDDTSRMRADRHARIPGLTPHDDPYRYLPSISSQYRRTFTTLGQAGSAVGAHPSGLPLTQPGTHNAASGLNTEGQDPSWPYRRPREPDMFTPASTRVYSYAMDLDIPSGPRAQIHNHREPVYNATANGPEAATLESPRRIDPRIPQPPLEPNRTQVNSVPTIDPRRQQPRQRLPSRTGPSTETDDYNCRLPHRHSAPRGRRRDPENERP